MEIREQLERLKNNIDGMPEKAALSSYITWLNQHIEQKSELFEKEYEPIVCAEAAHREAEGPFLTVVTRTQGKRPEMLRETLLSLAGQTDRDFEVLLIGHKLDAQQEKLVKQILWEQPDDLRKKIRFIKLSSGTRTTPLNLGFAYAHGRYVSILDDDDIALDNWVESFHKAALKHPGRILHAYVFAQEWMTISTESGFQALRAVGAPKAVYCEAFDYLSEMRVNKCPPMGLSFPAFYFQKLGLIFDERLTTTEDWDYLMRVSFIAGVTDIKTATAIYRLWINAENSQTVHSQKEWTKNYAVISKRFMDMPILIPQGSRKSVANESMIAQWGNSWPYRAPRINWCTLYLNRGKGFCQSDSIGWEAMSNGTIFDVEFHLAKDKANDISQIRFDVCEEGMFVIQNFVAVIRYWDGSSETRTIEECQSNGAKAGGAICFLKADPWIIWKVDQRRKLESVRVIGETHVNMTQQLVEAACKTLAGGEFQLFYRTQKTDFCEEQSYRQYASNGFFQLEFPMNTGEKITALRLDPGEDAGVLLRNLMVEVVDSGNNITYLSFKTGHTNGRRRRNWLVFTCTDPQIMWPVRNKDIRLVRVSSTFDRLTLEENAIQKCTKPNLLSRIWNQLRSLLLK